jgi:hypothetical protein
MRMASPAVLLQEFLLPVAFPELDVERKQFRKKTILKSKIESDSVAVVSFRLPH